MAMKNLPAKRLRIGLLTGAFNKDQVLFRGAAAAAKDHGADLFCFVGENYKWGLDFASQSAIFANLVDLDRFDGLVTWAGAGVGLGFSATEQEITQFFARFSSLPIVNYEKKIPGLRSIRTDTAEGMKEVLRHLIEGHGRRRILLLRGPHGHYETEERIQAYRDTLQAAGLAVDGRLILPAFTWKRPLDHMLAKILDEYGLEPGVDFDSIAGTEAFLACAAVRVLQARGVNVPQDVAVVGFNESQENSAIHPPLTTYEKPFFSSGYRAVETVIDLIHGRETPEDVVLPGRLIIRGSCGCSSSSILAFRESLQIAKMERSGETYKGIGEPSQHDLELLSNFDSKVSPSVGSAAGNLPALWMIGLWKAFAWDLEGKTQSGFVDALNSMMANSTSEGRRVDWNRLLTRFRVVMQPRIPTADTHAAEDLWQQARLVIQEYYIQEKSRLVFESDRNIITLNNIGVALNSSVDYDNLLDRIAAYLPELGIPSCYISACHDPANPTGMVRLVMAYRDNQRIALDRTDLEYLAKRLLPDDLLPSKISTLVIEPLIFGPRRFGFVVFERADTDDIIFEYLQMQISSAYDRIYNSMATRESEQRYHLLVDNLREMILVHRDGNLLFANSSAREYLKKNGAEKQLLERVLERTAWLNSRLNPAELEGYRQSDFEIDIPDGGGGCRRMIVRFQDITYSHVPAEQIILVDITERKRMEDHLFYISSRDALTGLYNRMYFEQEMNRLKNYRTEVVSVIMADVDGLKQVNDRLGHAAGDELLRLVADALRNAFRGEDTLSRIGGDEFAAIIAGMDEAGMSKAIERVHDHLDEINQGFRAFQVNLSIGGATSGVDTNLEDAFRRADQEMYRQKALTRLKGGFF